MKATAPMNTFRLGWLLACGLLTACAATRPIENAADGCEVTAEAAPLEQLCAESSSLVVLCDERQCGAYRCHEVLERLTTEQVVLARQPVLPRPNVRPGNTGTEPDPLPSPGPGVERYRGRTQGSSGSSQPVFIIPWGPKPKPELLPSQKQLLAEAEASREKTYEGHHIYPQAFREWFTAQGIDIDAYILPLEIEEHRRIHRGADGGPWNAAWLKFIRANRRPNPVEIHQHAGQLIYEFRLLGPILPYKLWRLQPPPVQLP